MKWFISHETLKSDFLKAVEETSGEDINLCYQCGKCSAGCPICFEMDYTPNQVVRMVQLGMKDEVLSSSAIWLCASCLTCTTRCPREVDLAAMMDALRRLSIRENIVPKEEGIATFNDAFLRNIRRYGRLFEIGLIGSFNIRSGHFLRNIMKAPAMLLKGKIALFPHRVKNMAAVKRIFKKSKEVEFT